ncbi:MAG: chemotaxis protein CheX [Planctomycetota bacterium]|nr:chemotaxis protein CheX [Planctomycetota bacterium]
MPQAQTIESAVNPNLVTPFINSVRDVFDKMAGVKITAQEPHLKAGKSTGHDISGIIGFSGAVAGSVVVSFPKAVAERLVEAFVRMPLECGTPDFVDAVGELVNMIAGSAKPYLGGVASISLPSVVIGQGYTVASMSSTPCVIIPCSSPHGDFAIELCIARQAGA